VVAFIRAQGGEVEITAVFDGTRVSLLRPVESAWARATRPVTSRVEDRAVTTAELPHPITEDSPAPRSMADAPLPAYESHSSISVYRACPLRYGFRYVERRPGEVSPGQFAFGNAVHKAFEAFGRARILARAQGTPEPGSAVLQDALDRKLASSGLSPDEVVEARRRAGPVLARFLELEAGTAAEPVAVELGFGVDVALPGVDVALPGDGAGDDPAEPGTIRFVGFVDRVDRAPDGSTEIVDYKTGRARSQADVDADTQLTAYAFGCARGGLHDPATREILPPATRLGLYFAESGELAWTIRSEEQLVAFEAGLVETVGRIRARAFAARPAPWRCRWCEYRRECPEVSPEA
jgi:RecB family exonuclease